MIRKFEDFNNLNESLKPSRIHKTKEIDGYKILIGKNAEMNDILTFDIANNNDIWMHASGVPGSHVIIKIDNKEYPPKNVIEEAAKLAAYNSKGQGKIKIIYTERKNVKKDSDHNPGQVSVDYKKSKFIYTYK
jgi:predicted ribosome quality control (RQC) complex YloA/Tae2 family protein